MRRFVAAVMYCVYLLVVAPSAYAESTTAEAKKELTPEQQKVISFLGLNPSAANIQQILQLLSGGCEMNPYPELTARYSLPRDVVTGQPMKIAPHVEINGGTSQGIHPVLACRLLKLFQSLEREQGCLIKISSAYRTNAEQARACGSGGTGCLGAGKSCHNYGLAVDIVGSCVSRLRAFLGQKDPTTPGARRFGLHFPYSGDHLQCIENRVASCSSGGGCGSGFAINPDTSGFPAGGLPTQSLAQAVREWLKPTPTPTPQSPAQALPQSSQLFNAFSPLPEPIILPPSGSASSSIADQLEKLAFGTGASTTAATSSTSTIPLIINPRDVGTITSTRPNTVVVATAAPPFSPPSTFTSDDLNWQRAWNATESNGYQQILENIRTALLQLLTHLRPFGGARDMHEHEMHLE